LHQKRFYISTLRKIRSGAVYSLFQANNLYQKLVRLDRKLAFIRDSEVSEGSGSEGGKFDANNFANDRDMKKGTSEQ